MITLQGEKTMNKKDKIKKLLTSNNLEDVMIGWELLKAKEIPHNDIKWYEYLDCFVLKTSVYEEEIHRLSCKCISEICPMYTTDPFWLGWQEHVKKIQRKYEIQNIHK